MSLNLDSRPCKIGPSINTRTEKHGDDDVHMMDIPLLAVGLQKAELNALLGENLAWDSIFNERADGYALPLLRSGFWPNGIDLKFDDADITIRLGIKRKALELLNVKISKLVLDPQDGGTVALKLTVSTRLTEETDELFAWMNRDAEVAIAAEDPVVEAASAEDQPDLPLNNFGDGEAPPVKRGRPRKEQPVAH